MMNRLLWQGVVFLTVIGFAMGLVEWLWKGQLTASGGFFAGGGFALVNCLVLMLAYGPVILRREKQYRAPVGIMVSFASCGLYAYFLSQSTPDFCVGSVFGLASPIGFGLMWSTKWQLGG